MERSALLDAVLARHLPRLRAFVRLRIDPRLRARISGADVVQSVCAELLDRDDFEFRGEVELRRWLYEATLNKLRSVSRKHLSTRRDAGRELPQGEQDALAGVYGRIATPSQIAVGRERLMQFEQAFDALPEHYREVITLARIVGLSQRDVAEEMGRSVGSVRNLLWRALARLASLMDTEGSTSA